MSKRLEQNYKSFRHDLIKIRNQKEKGAILDFEEALETVRELLGEELVYRMDRSDAEEENFVKDKEYLRKKKSEFQIMITEIVLKENIRVRGYDNIDNFIEELVGEFAGYSVFEDAFKDPQISDIYGIRWDLIIVEKNGVNEVYPKKFRNAKHYKDVIERFVREAGKEVNNGDSSIVDFELYGDRGCVTSPKVSPEDYSITLRKHAEDHIKRDDIVNNRVVNQEMADFLGTLILGEVNLIYAGLTGSGKTTTIRALLDYYVSRANKRMLVVEDTQELFPENQHTLSLVSVKNDDPKVAVPLTKLILTALRLKPKYIVVGEVRGEEAQAMVEGMETGHSTITTMHGGNTWNIINRLVTKYLMAMPSLGIDVVERIIGSSLDYVCIQDNIPGIGRKCTSIVEVTYNFETRRVDLKTIFRFDFEKMDFVMENKISKEKAETMLRRGVKWDEIKQWVA